MKRCIVLSLLFSAAVALSAADTSAGPPPSAAAAPFAVRVTPELSIPLGENSGLFTLGGGAGVTLEYAFPTQPIFFVTTSIGYDYAPALIGRTFSLPAASAGAGMRYLPLPWLQLSASMSAGGYYSFLNDFTNFKGYLFPYLSAGAECAFLLTPAFSLGINADYKWNVGFYGGLSLAAGATVRFGTASGPGTPSGLGPSLTPLQSDALQISHLELEKVFPVFFSFYNSHPVGKLVVKNTSAEPLTDVKASLFVNSYMDAPKETAAIPALKAGESASLDLFALFNDSVLGITEGKQVAVTVTVDFKAKGRACQNKMTDAMDIQYRNAMTWDDDRRAAVFVTAKDPVVLGFVKNVKSMVANKGSEAVDKNWRLAAALHEALRLLGVAYSPDPKSPFSEKKKDAADFLQFPRETLEYKGGDCDDLSILYAALLESVGVETAFITVPGHIYIAFALDMSPEGARSRFSRRDNLVFRNEKAWVPLEITDRNEFLQAWLTGAKEWRENTSRNQSTFLPMRDCWQAFTPVQLPGSGGAVALPEEKKIVDAYITQVSRFIDSEIEEQVTILQQEIRNTRESARSVNKLGVLYARYELWDKAEAQFARILGREQYVPALLNMGNIQARRGNSEKALEYYSQASRRDPTDAKVVLAIARINHDMENYGEVSKLYRKLKEMSPSLAAEYAYLDLRGEEAARAAEAINTGGKVLWDED